MIPDAGRAGALAALAMCTSLGSGGCATKPALSREGLVGGVSYEIAGTGCPVVLIAGGGGMDRRQWDAQFEHLRHRFEVVRFEPRNVGKSEVARAAYSDSEDLAAVLDALGLPGVVLVGLSSGGGIAIDFALTWPDRVRGLVLAAPFVQGFGMSENQQRRVADFASASAEGVESGIRAFLSDPHFVPAPRNAAARRRAEQLMRENARSAPGSLRQSLDPPAVDRLRELTRPTLLLIGALDHPDLHHRVDFLSEILTNSTKVVLADAGHMSNLENPRDFNRLVAEFLSRYACPSG